MHNMKRMYLAWNYVMCELKSSIQSTNEDSYNMKRLNITRIQSVYIYNNNNNIACKIY